MSRSHHHHLSKDQRRAYAQMCANELASTSTNAPAATKDMPGIRPAVLPSLKFGDTIVMRDGRTYRGRPPQYQFVSSDGGLTGHWVKSHKGLPYVRVLDRALQK